MDVSSVWISLPAIADAANLSPVEVTRRLERLGFISGDQPTERAEYHRYAHPDQDLFGTRWHRDLVLLLNDDGGDPSKLPAIAAVPPRSRGPVGRPPRGFDMVFATDGSCSGNPGPGGWAWVEQITGQTAAGGAKRTTNNQMELIAVLKALEFAGPEGDILLRIDSSYVRNALTKWAPGWRANGWIKKSDKKPVANREIIEPLLELYESRIGRTEVEVVRGHSGDPANELADTLAVEQTQRYAR